jgi:hypothetical protein
MSSLTFSKVLELRKIIRNQTELIQHQANQQDILLSDRELLGVSKKCQNCLVPGMKSEDVHGAMSATIEEAIKAVRSQRLASNILHHKDDPQ